jgi:oligopeptide transport system ATP-binding protein
MTVTTVPTVPAGPGVPAAPGTGSTPLLEVSGLRVEFRTARGTVTVLDGVDYQLHRGRTLAVVGESGSGKSVTARAIMGILPRKAARITGGSIKLAGVDVLRLPESQRRAVRGARIAMIFQDALSALNPVLPVGFQIVEGCRRKEGLSRSAGRRRAVELMDQVGIPAAAARVDAFPHEFSGGMRQRAMIAMALARDPEVLIADEPTTALDVTIQAQILRLLADLQAERNMGLVMITHDMGVVANTADEIAVMYAGRVVERGSAADIFATPAHPYTRALLGSIPRPELRGLRLPAIAGSPPDPSAKPSGCPFRSRCPQAIAVCATDPPVVRWMPGGDGDPTTGTAGNAAGAADPGAVSAAGPVGAGAARTTDGGDGAAEVTVGGDGVARPAAERMASCHLLTPPGDRS